VELTLVREPTCDGFTRGELLIDGVHECYTLEDQVRDVKIPGETAIPAGRYRVVLTHSPRFKKVLPELLKVPGYTGIRIHAGNDASHTEGCILVGQRQGKSAVFESRDAMIELMAALDAAVEGGEQIWIEVRNADPAVS
jgi:hypothetical protein